MFDGILVMHIAALRRISSLSISWMIAHYAYDFIGSVDFRQMFQFDVRGTNQVIGITNIEIVMT